MGLETASFISGLTLSWPTSTDFKAQGDDHIRLLKSVLQGTFPNANKAFYFPKYAPINTPGNSSIDATYQNAIVALDTTAGQINLTLPTLASGDAGWSCRVMALNYSLGGLAALVLPASGTISTPSGAVTNVRVGIINEPATFFWTGSSWLCAKPGPPIGSILEFAGANLPSGYLWANASIFASAVFTELFAVLGTTTLPDHSERVVIGRSGMGGAGGAGARLTVGVSGIDASVLGNAGGDERLATHSHGNNFAVSNGGSHDHALGGGTLAQFAISSGSSGPFLYGAAIGGGWGLRTDTVAAHSHALTGGVTNFTAGNSANVQPGVVVNKIVRAC